MRRFILYFIAFLFICFCIIEVFLMPLASTFEQSAYKSKTMAPYCRINFVTECKDVNADLIIIGNSRAEGSYNDALLSEQTGLKCINLGMAGFPFNFQYHIMYKTYVRQNSIPKYVLVEVGPFSFFDYSTPPYTIEMLPYIDRPEFKFYFETCPELSYLDHYRIVRYAGKYEEMVLEIQKLKDSLTTNSVQTFLANDTLSNIAMPTNEGYEKNYLKKKKFDLEKDPNIINLFNSFLDECEKQGTQVVLVCSPIHTTDGASHFDMQGFWNLMTEIAGKHKVKVLNYENLFGNDIKYFSNSMHLNIYGINCFTRKIAHDLDSMVFRLPTTSQACR